MSLLPYATLYGPGLPIYIPVGTQVSSFGISSLNANTITVDRIISGESIFSTIIGSNVYVSNLDASYIQVLDTLNSYFTNSEYATVNCNLTVSNDSLLNQVFANYVSSEAIANTFVVHRPPISVVDSVEPTSVVNVPTR